MQSNQCQLFEPHEPLVVLVEYDMCSLLQFPSLQVMPMMMLGMRITVMSIRFGVNQSTVSLCGASVESVVYFMLSFLYKTMWYIIFRYVINTSMVYLRFFYLCVRLFLGHIWVFYASYFVLKIWVWHFQSKSVVRPQLLTFLSVGFNMVALYLHTYLLLLSMSFPYVSKLAFTAITFKVSSSVPITHKSTPFYSLAISK